MEKNAKQQRFIANKRQFNRGAQTAERARKRKQATTNGGRYFKASCLNYGEKIVIIKANKIKYTISNMCKLLGVSRNSVYYVKKEKEAETELKNRIAEIFNSNRKVYGTRKIKKELSKETDEYASMRVSRRKIGKIMKEEGLVSKYTQKQFTHITKNTNDDLLPNIVNRDFSGKATKEVVVSDLTYVDVQGKWNYICLITDLANREIIGFSAGANKTAQLVKKAIYSIKGSLSEINIFHTDRGSEFKNSELDAIFGTFNIKRSLSAKGCPYDNAVAESLYNILKVELIFGEKFYSLEHLQYELFDYVNWYNTKRIHGSLGYLTPIEYRAC